MAVNLNLLPSDYEVSDSVAKLIKSARQLNVILLAIFFAGALSMAGFFVFSAISLQNLNTQNTNIRNQIQVQQTAQQQVVLLKDRLSKIKRVQAVPGAAQNLTAISPLIGSVSDSGSVSELNVSPQKTSMSLTFRTNSDLVSFIKTLNGNTNFSSITMDSFSYNPTTGYLVSFSFSGKKQ